MLIIATERNRYRQVYTDQIWNVEVSDDKTPFQTYLLEQIRAFLSEIRSMNLLADEEGLTLNSQERQMIIMLPSPMRIRLTSKHRGMMYTQCMRPIIGPISWWTS